MASNDGADPDKTAQFAQSFARGLSVIRAFGSHAPEMTLSDIARATDLTRATARRFLHTLVELGYVRTDGRIFALTPHVLELGFAFLSGLTLPEIAQPHLEELSRRVDESTSASVLDGSDIVYVARVHTRRIMTVRITIGTRFPAHATSMGRVLLAALPDDRLDAYLDRLDPTALTTRTVTNVSDLRGVLNRVREDGWSLVDQELEYGLRSVAAPVSRPDGEVVAAINISSSSLTVTMERIRDEFLPVLLETSARISADLRHI